MTERCRFVGCTEPTDIDSMFCGMHNGRKPASAGLATHDTHMTGSARAAERAIRQQPDHADEERYGWVMADTLSKWFGNQQGLVIARVIVRILEERQR